jgi:hypothetical protein
MPDIHIVVITSNSLNRSGIESLIANGEGKRNSNEVE